MPMSPRLLRPLASRFLLDQFGGADAAYSLRRLRGGAGSVVRVRRANDNAEDDFTPEEIGNGILTQWTGANDGFVVTWYDQSGNARHATQATAASQPKIVSSGSVILEDGKPAIEFDGSNDFLAASTTTDFADTASIFAVENATVSAGVDTVIALCEAVGVAANFQNLHRLAQTSSGGGMVMQTGDNGVFRNISTGIAPSYKICAYLVRSPSLREGYVNGAALGTDTTSVTLAGLSVIGVGALGVDYMSGTVQELIVYPTDVSFNRQRIENNINAYFGIF